MTERRIHDLKAEPRFFRALCDGTKTFEVRRDDRAYAEGDVLRIHEWDPTDSTRCKDLRCPVRPPRRTVTFFVSYLLPGGQFGIERGHVVLGLRPAVLGDVAKARQ